MKETMDYLAGFFSTCRTRTRVEGELIGRAFSLVFADSATASTAAKTHLSPLLRFTLEKLGLI